MKKIIVLLALVGSYAMAADCDNPDLALGHDMYCGPTACSSVKKAFKLKGKLSVETDDGTNYIVQSGKNKYSVEVEGNDGDCEAKKPIQLNH